MTPAPRQELFTPLAPPALQPRLHEVGPRRAGPPSAYTARTLPEDRSFSGFLAQLSRLREASLDQPRLRLLTLHAAKGAEFKAVAVLGPNEGTIPYYPAVEEGDRAVNEERQALYVAITRPSRALLVTRARRRTDRYGRVWPLQPSRYLGGANFRLETR